MRSERNNMVVREFIEAINRQDWSQLDVVVVAGVVRHSSTSAQPQVRSRDDLKGSRWREATIFPDAHEHNHFFVAEGNKVSARLAFRGTREHWPRLREGMLAGTYRPSPVKRVEIPKPSGGVRKLGLPTVLDRCVKQAVLQLRWDRTFSAGSYGSRPGRSAHQAVAQAQRYLREGDSWVVDLDLEQFFDRVNQDKLMSPKIGPLNKIDSQGPLRREP